jgi:phosphate starvation-inducible PhoH-like protein
LKRAPSEFLPLADEALRAVSGPGGRHAALIEDAFKVLMETPGGGVALNGDAEARRAARQVIEVLSGRVAQDLEVTPADVRLAIDQARGGAEAAHHHATRRGTVAAKSAAQARYLDALAEHDLVFGLGPAGTGKTFLAVAHGAALLRSGAVERLVITRPAVEAGERLGFLPGDLTEKVDPYMAPVWEALTTLLGAEALRKRRDRGEIEVAPIAFMRGRTLSHAYIIVDEAQNTSRLQMKMVLTRIGEGSRMAVTGDPSQVDLLNPADSGLQHAVSILEGVEGVSIAHFTAADVVRHPLVRRIVRAYDADAARRKP